MLFNRYLLLFYIIFVMWGYGYLISLGIDSDFLRRIIKVVGIYFFLITFQSCLNRSYWIPFIFLSFFVIGPILEQLYFSEYFNLAFISPLSSFGVALYFVKNGNHVLKHIKLFFVVYTTIYIVSVLIGVARSETILFASYNGVFINALILFCIIAALEVRDGKKISYYFYWLLILFGFLTGGRMNIIVSTLMSVIMLGLYLDRSEYAKLFSYLAVGSVLASILLIVGMDAVRNNLFSLDNVGTNENKKTLILTSYFERKKFNDPRWHFWRDYFEGQTIATLMFGGNSMKNASLSQYGYKAHRYNYHNSYIQIHKVGGLIAVVAIILLIFVIFVYGARNLGWEYLALMFLYLLRGVTDVYVLYSFFGFLIFMFMIVSLQGKVKYLQQYTDLNIKG